MAEIDKCKMCRSCSSFHPSVSISRIGWGFCRNSSPDAEYGWPSVHETGVCGKYSSYSAPQPRIPLAYQQAVDGLANEVAEMGESYIDPFYSITAAKLKALHTALAALDAAKKEI